MELTWEDNGGGSMGPNTLLRLDGKCVGHFYEDAAKGIDGDQVRDDIAIRYNAHDALVAALEQSKFALETLNIRNGQCGWLIAKIDAALAQAGVDIR